MFVTVAERLVAQLSTTNPQLANQVFKESSTWEQVRIWWQWGKQSSVAEAQWLARRTTEGALSVPALFCALSAIWGREGLTLVRVQTRFAVILEEMGLSAEELSEPKRRLQFAAAVDRDREADQERARVRAGAAPAGATIAGVLPGQ